MSPLAILSVLLAAGLSLCNGAEIRDPKQGIFSIVRFANDPCAGTSGTNGTCMSAAECSAVAGTASGSCAESFGVCCVVSLGCGGSTSTNNTYLTLSATTTSQACSYTVCPASTDVCQIRIDFDKAVLAPSSTTAGSLGQCIDDNLVVSSPGGANPPVLCGTLTGEHMFIDADSDCHTVTAMLGSTDTTTSRELSVKITQIECTNVLRAPSGCLQYFTGTTGNIYNFGNSQASAGGTAASTTNHLSSQQYNICFRREEGYCSMEYSAVTTAFAVGVNAIAGQSLFGDSCTGDYLRIPGLQDATPGTATATTDLVTAIGDRICGRLWAYPAGTTQATLITFAKPFVVGVNFDSTDDASANDAQVGFAITYTQKACS